MSYQFGKNLKITIFGESHQKAVGCVIEGLPAGLNYPQETIATLLAQRKPGQRGATSRNESDEPIILSGLYHGKFTGSALAVQFENNNTKSSDYPLFFRPSHSDYPAYVKYHGYNDIRGGGQFSARLTLPLVFAGAICLDLLKKENVTIHITITQVGHMKISEVNEEVYQYLENLNGDSVGGKIHCEINNLPVGLGSPLFDSIESRLSHLLFSIPGVKGVLFGDALEMSEGYGSKMNDCYEKVGDKIITKTNHNGGILGGLSTGMPIVFDTLFKPTSSIALKQNTYDPQTDSQIDLEIKGRHDPCIALRAVPVVKACAALVIYDLYLDMKGASM